MTRSADFLRPRSHRYALESRQLFDGAILVEAAAAAAPADAHAPAADEAHHASTAEMAHPVSVPSARDAQSEAAQAAPAAEAGAHEVYVIDKNVAHWEQLAQAVPAGAQVVLLETDSSGVAQLARALEGQHDITAIHILSHGAAGEITLGNETYGAASLGAGGAAADAWRAIGAHLSAEGDILLYGCDVGADHQQFALALAGLTGADVASSLDATGAAARQGDWALEASTGGIEARAFAADAFDGLLAAPTITTTATRLTVAEPSVLNEPGADRAQLSGWTILDDGSGNVTVTVTVEDPSKGWISSASTAGVTSVTGGLRFVGSVADANAWVNQLVFNAADVELGNTAAETRILVNVVDSESPALSASRALNVTITPSNDPVTLADAAQSVNEIGSTVLDRGTFAIVDPEVTAGTQTPDQIVYGLTANPLYGYLTLNGERLGVGSVFTQADIIAGRLSYVHTATGTDQNLADRFSVAINDGATLTSRSDTATITLNVTSLNQAPSVGGSGAVFEGQPANALDAGGRPISVVGDLIVAGGGGGDDADATLRLRLDSLPTDGTLYFTGTAVVGGQTVVLTQHAITQADINAGFEFAYGARGGLSYGNDGQRDNDADPATGYPFTDGFDVTVFDGGGGTGVAGSSSGRVAITVRPANDDPVFDPGSTLEATVPPAGTGNYTVPLTPDMLRATDVDSSNERLTFVVTSMSGLDQGRLLLDGKALPIGATFTMADVIAGRVSYVQQLGAAAGDTDSFQFQVVDNTLGPRWNPDGTQVTREGGVYDDHGSATLSDDTLRTFTFTIHLAETPAGNGGALTPLDVVVEHQDSSHAGTSDQGEVRGTLYEGGSVVLAGTGADFSQSPGLSYTVSGVDPSQVVYTILAYTGTEGPVRNGSLQRLVNGTWQTLDTFETFTQADLDAGRIRFQHNGDVEDFHSAVQLSVSAGVIRNGQPDVWNTSFNFFITPVNDAPVVAGSSNTVIREGETAYITTGQLGISDPDDAVSESYLENATTPNFALNHDAAHPLQFRITTLPAGGTLQYLDNGVWKDVTPGMLLNASLITGSAGTTGLRFVSDGSEVRSTTFQVQAVDRWGQASNTASVGIQITNVNDAPAIAPDPTQPDPAGVPASNNNPLTVTEGGYGRITAEMLRAVDPDSTTQQVQYTITRVPAHGSIAYSTDGVTFRTLGVGSSFTQEDVNKGYIYYLHNGDESTGTSYPATPGDTFRFNLGDGDKEQRDAQFWIYVAPANDPPTVTAPTGPINIDSSNAQYNPVSGFQVGDTDLDTLTGGETDFIQVTVRLLNADGSLLTNYSDVTISVGNLAGATRDGDLNGVNDLLELRGTRAQINAALATLRVTFGTDKDQLYQVQVIADDRLRNLATGALLNTGANGGTVNESVPAGQAGTAISTVDVDLKTTLAIPAGLAGNVAAASVVIRASSVNDRGELEGPGSVTTYEDQATYIGGSFVVRDAESTAFGTPITITLSVPTGQGTLGIGGSGAQTSYVINGRTVTISGDNTRTLVLTGRADDIQALLNSGATGLTYTSAANANHDQNGPGNGINAGDVTLTVTFDDGGSRIGGDTGSGSVANNPDDIRIAITIVAVNDAPTVSLGTGINRDTPLFLTGGGTPTSVPGFTVGDVDITDAGGIATGETDFLQVTVRITDGSGNALASSYYDGTNGAITIGSSNAASSGVQVDSAYDGTGSALVIRGSRAEVQAYLDGLRVSLGGALANSDQAYRVQVIADDRLRNNVGSLIGGANGGNNNNASGGTSNVSTTGVNPYGAIPGGLTANVASNYRTLFPSAINDPAHIDGTIGSYTENAGTITLSGLSISDQDAGSSSTLTVTLSVPGGFSFVGGTAVAGGGSTISFTGTLAQINTWLATVQVNLPDAPGAATAADWNGSFQLTVRVDDNGNTGGRPGTLAPGNNATTGTYDYENGTNNHLITTRSFNVVVAPANDAPVIANGDTETLPAVNEDVGTTTAGRSVSELFAGHFSDEADRIDNSGVSATGGSASDSFFGVAITGVALDAAQGRWQYSLDGTTWIDVGARTDANALVLSASARLRFVPAADFHGTPNTLTVRLVETDTNNDSATADPGNGSVVDLSAASAKGGTTVYSTGTIALSTHVSNVNDRPTGADATLPSGTEDTNPGAGQTRTVAQLFGSGYSDQRDNQSAIAGGNDAATAFGGIAITGNAATAGQGSWQYSLDGSTWVDVPATLSDTQALLLPTTAQLRFVPAADFNGTPGGLSVRLSDTPVAAMPGGVSVDLGAAVDAQTSQWSATRALSTSIAPRNDAPVIGGTTGGTATENGETGTGTSIPPTALVSDATVSDLDLGTTAGLTVFGAGTLTVNLDDWLTGDRLTVAGALPAGVTFSGGTNGAALVISFDADTTVAQVRAVLEQLRYSSSSDNPTGYGLLTTRTYSIQLNDGNNQQAGGNAGGPALASNLLTGTLDIVAVNDAPLARDDTHSISEDQASVGSNVITGRVAGEGDSDPDNQSANLSVSGVRTGPEAGTGTTGNVGQPIRGEYGTLVLNADGSYTYTLDNTDPRVQALIAGETLTERFTYTLSDPGGATDTAQLTITINGAADGSPGDDQPSLTVNDANGAAAGQVTVSEAGLTSAGDTSETAGSHFTLNAADGIASVTVGGTTLTLAQLQALSAGSPVAIGTPDGTLYLTGFTAGSTVGSIVTSGQVDYTYTLGSAQDHSSGPVTDVIALQVRDRDGDTAQGNLTVLILNDAPSASDDTNQIKEDAVPGFVTGNVKSNDALGADFGNGVSVTAVSSGATVGTVGQALKTEYGSIVLNADGSYTYTLDNGDARVNALKDGQTLTDTVSYTITDADGDTSTATLRITIRGTTDLVTGPSITPVDGNGAAAGQAEVHERGLVDGASGPDTSETTTGRIDITAADGLDSLTVGGTTVSLAQLGNLGTTPVVIDTGEGVLTLTGFTATTIVGGVPTAGELRYTYTLKGQQPQPGAGESLDTIALVVTDAGGATSSGSLVVRIVDDAPVAADDTATIDEDGPTDTVQGNLKGNDRNGADDANGVPVTGVSYNGVPGALGSPITTAYGSIVVNADGSYTYVLDNANPAVQHLIAGESLTEALSYTITDADGDTSTATLTITIRGANDGATLTLVDGNSGATGQATVDERGLNDPANGSETTGGSFVIRTPDGLGSLEIGGTVLTPAQLAALGSTPIVIDTGKGRLTLTGHDEATGTVRYTYTLGSAQSHAGGEVTDDIAITVRDRDGDAASGTLRVLVLDDAPLARDDAASVGNVTPNTSVSGNVLGAGGAGGGDVSDRLGADAVANPVTGVAFEGQAGTIGTGLAGRYGTLTLGADGRYTYAVNAGNQQVASLDEGRTLTEVFTYTITDADGSTSTAQLVITIRGTSTARPLTGDQIFPTLYPAEARRIDQGMAPAIFVQVAVQESEQLSEALAAGISERAFGGLTAFASADRGTDLRGAESSAVSGQSAGRDGLAYAQRMALESAQTLAQRGVSSARLWDELAPLPGDTQPQATQLAEADAAAEPAVASAAPAAPAAPRVVVQVPGAAERPQAQAPHAEAGERVAVRAKAAPGEPARNAEAPRSFSSRVAASAQERGTVRDIVKVQAQASAPAVKVPVSASAV